MTEIAWLTSAYPWSGEPVGGIFFRTQALALARAGLALTVVAPVPAVPWPLAHLSAKWRGHSRVPREQLDGDIEVFRPRFLNVPGQPSWAMPDRLIADAAWRTHAVGCCSPDPRPLFDHRPRRRSPGPPGPGVPTPDVPRQRHKHLAECSP